MKTKDLIVAAILLAIGTVLHAVSPPFFFGIKPDLLLSMMFISIIYKPELKNTIVIGIAAGIIAALTTGAPGGQIPSIVDKFGSAIFVYFALKLIPGKLSLMKTFILGLLGTLVSGILFLFMLKILVGLPGDMGLVAMVNGIVIPTAIINAILLSIMYRIIATIIKRERM